MLKNNLLPTKAYTDNQWFELEQQHIFSTTWQFAGLVEDIKAPGDFISVKAGNYTILVVMAQDETLRAFHNICRHRGTELLHARGTAKTIITCPYHDWSYDLTGELIAAPKAKKEFENLDKSCWSLKKASVAIYHGMLFVHPKPNAEPINQWFNGIEPYLPPYDPTRLIEDNDNVYDQVIHANWKIIVENYIDHYHLAQLHRGTLNMYDHQRAEFGFIGAHFGFKEPLTEEYKANLAQKSYLPLIKGFTAQNYGAYVPMLFPGIGISGSESSWSVFHIQPLSANKSRVIIRSKVEPSSNWQYYRQAIKSRHYWQQQLHAKYQDLPVEHPLGSGDFMQEDVYVCEQHQKALTNPAYEPGPSALYGELPIRQHQQIVMQYLSPYLQEISETA